MSDATMVSYAPFDNGSRRVEANSVEARDDIRSNLILGAAVTAMGTDVDQPRNLAKSVTVE